MGSIGLTAQFAPWILSELELAFSHLQKMNALQIHCCFFVDGLDEQIQNVDETIKILKQIVSSSSIKLCVSSRPWNVFQNSFEGPGTHRLDVQNLAKHDIELDVDSELKQNEMIAKMEGCDMAYKLLVSSIVHRAQGVFLWVSLVIKSLVRGLYEGHEIIDLQGRLDSIPDSLTDFFRRIFESIDIIYRPHTAQTLLLLSQPSVGDYPYLLLMLPCIAQTGPN